MEVSHLLSFPFLACILLVMIHVNFGNRILERGIIFVDFALAQSVGIGIALSFLFTLLIQKILTKYGRAKR